MKHLIVAILFLTSSPSFSVEHWKDIKSNDGKAVLKEMSHEDGLTSAWLYTEGKAAEELFNLLSKNRHAAKVQNPGVEEIWLGDSISCLKFLKEKNRILCSQEIMKPTSLK